MTFDAAGLIHQKQDDMVEDELHKVAARLFREYGVDAIEVQPDVDQAGEPVISVVVTHRLLDRPIEFKSLFPLDSRLRDSAWEAGERRFVHVRHRYDDKQQFADAG